MSTTNSEDKDKPTIEELSSSTNDSTGKLHEVDESHIIGSLPHCPQCVVVRKGR